MDNLRGANAYFAYRANGKSFLRATGHPVTSTVFDDASLDVFIGSGGQDWCIAKRHGPGVHDLLVDLGSDGP